MNAMLNPETPKDAARRLSVGAVRDGFKPQALHVYNGADGQPSYWRLRLKHPATGDKWIRPMWSDSSGYIIGEPPAPADGKPLYRLPELLAADTALPVLIVEGEWCADKLANLGMIVTTSGSAASAGGADWTPLQGRSCIVWPDHDKAGANYADAVTAALHAQGCTVQRIDVEALGLPPKGDAVDWLADHPDATAADVLALARLTPEKTGVTGVAGVTLGVSRAAPPHLATPAAEGVAKKAARARFDLMVKQPHRMDGVYWVGTARDNDTGEEVEKEPEWICSPMVVAATTRNSDGSDWGRQLVFTDRDGLEHRWAMPQMMTATDGAELRTELLRQGLEIATDGNRRRKLLDYIQWANPATAARCVTRTGWHDDAFVLPAFTYNDEAEPVIYQAATLDGVALGQGGTLEGWREQVAMPSTGNSRLVLSIAAGFAGPCLGLAGAEGGGIHLRGSSSIGKSTALQVAGSIFGPARFVRTWRQTDNALEGVASLHSDLLLILDEIKELAAKDAGAVAYMLGNGQGKGRANRSGAARAAARWRLLFLSSGEVGLGELIAQDGGQLHAGHEVRFIDVPADAGAGLGLLDCVPVGVAPGQFAEQLKAAAATHYGHALPAFLERLTADVAGNRTLLVSMRDALTDELVSGADDGQVRRVAQRFALIAAAGELATQWGLTGWPVEEAEQAARACFRDWLAARGTKGNAEPGVAMLAAVKDFLERHGESRFTPWFTEEHSPRTVNRAGYRKATDAGPEYYVESGVFKNEVAKGFDSRAVARLLIEHGCMLPGSDGKASRSERLPDNRTARVYRITPKLWEVEL